MEEDSLMIVGGKGSTSIIVEGTTTESSDTDKASPATCLPKVNGQPVVPAQDSEEVFIIVNKTTNIQNKVPNTLGLTLSRLTFSSIYRCVDLKQYL